LQSLRLKHLHGKGQGILQLFVNWETGQNCHTLSRAWRTRLRNFSFL